MMLNRAMLIGNLGRDPEIRTTQAGQKIANLSLATSDRWKDRNSGEWRERTEWHRVVIFNGKLIDNVVEPYLQKGTKLYIEGKIQTRKWTDQAGQDRYTTEIVLQPFDGTILQLGNSATKAPGESAGSAAEVLDDEIPF